MSPILDVPEHKMHGFVGHAAWECGECHRVQTVPVFEVSSVHFMPLNCWHGDHHVVIPYPINDLAKAIDTGYRDANDFWALKAKARKHMAEVSW